MVRLHLSDLNKFVGFDSNKMLPSLIATNKRPFNFSQFLLSECSLDYDIIMRNSCSLNCSRRHSVIFLRQKRYKSELLLRNQCIFYRLPISDIFIEMWLQPGLKDSGAVR